MKKNILKGITVTMMAGMLITACGSKETGGTTPEVIEKTSQESAEGEDKAEQENTKEAEGKASAAEAVTVTSEDFVVTSLDDGTAMISRYSGEAESIIIPEEISGMPVTIIGGHTFGNHDELKSVVIPDSVIEIQESAFSNCFELKNVIMSKNVERIGTYAFSGPKLKEIELPDTLKEIGDSAFISCDMINITLPEGLEIIDEGAFCTNSIETLTIPKNVKKIEYQAFAYCKQLKTVVIEDGVEVIGEKAFCNCDLLESVTIPASVTEMIKPFVNSNNVTIYTTAGSYAETWAEENNVPCVVQ